MSLGQRVSCKGKHLRCISRFPELVEQKNQLLRLWLSFKKKNSHPIFLEQKFECWAPNGFLVHERPKTSINVSCIVFFQHINHIMEFKKLNKNVRWTRQGYFWIPLQMFMCQGIVLHVDNGPIPFFFGKKPFFAKALFVDSGSLLPRNSGLGRQFFQFTELIALFVSTVMYKDKLIPFYPIAVWTANNTKQNPLQQKQGERACFME